MKRIRMFALVALFFTLASAGLSFAEERPVLRIGDITDRSSKRVDGDNQLGLWRYLEDQLGMEIEYVQLSERDYAEGLSNGNLPDIVATDNNLSVILANGVALNLDPYLEEYVPNFLHGYAETAYSVFKELLGDNNGFYFFPARIGYNNVGFSVSSSFRGYVVRWDYYKELGYPPVHNEEDYLNVLIQMHEKHPYTEEGYPTYLYGTDQPDGYETAFWSKLSLDYWAAYKYQNNMFTNEIYDGYVDLDHSMWWASMKWFNKLYHAGKENDSFDIEMFTQTEEQFHNKRDRGQYLGLPAIAEQFYRNSIKEDPDTLKGYAMIPTDGTNLYTNVYQLLGNGSAYMWFISANSPNKEAALKLFNYMSDPDFIRQISLGLRGETWDYDEEGVPRMTEYGQEQLDAFMTGNASPDNYFEQWGSFRSLPNNWPILRDNLIHPDGYPLDFVTTAREYGTANLTNNIAKDICEHYEVELPLDATYKLGGFDFRNDCGEAISSCISSLDRDQLHILSEADNILLGAEVDLIMAENEDQWNAARDETLRKLEDLGEPEVFQAYQEKWDAAASIVVPLVFQKQEENGIKPYTLDEISMKEGRAK